ncbi:MAG: amidohydrolase [Planctomycetes bacterium]|nr:amidohydrolase [Planctomycetota bacterium]
MVKVNIDYRDCDREIWEDEFEDFVPSRILDAHIHFYWRSCIPGGDPAKMQREDNDLESLNQWAEVLYPGRRMQYLILGTPALGTDVAMHTEAVRSEIEGVPGIRHNRLVTPECKIEDIERDLKNPQFIGLKPYRIYSVTGDIAQCRIHEFLPHEQLEFANEHNLWVTMHLSRWHGCADHRNLDDLEEYTTKRYPNVKWLLAHCARSFTYWPMREAVKRLSGMPNIYYDTSAVTDPRPYAYLLKNEDPKRIFWGSDGVTAAFFHGYYAALGRAWQHFDADKNKLQYPHCDGRPILAVYEQLLSLKFAAEMAEYSKDQIEGLFWRNAVTAFGMDENEGATND